MSYGLLLYSNNTEPLPVPLHPAHTGCSTTYTGNGRLSMSIGRQSAWQAVYKTWLLPRVLPLQAVADKADMYLDFFLEVVRRTAQLVAAWMCVGFCHGAPLVWLCALLVGMSDMRNMPVVRDCGSNAVQQHLCARCRCAQHRQYEHPRPHHRLRPVRFHGQVYQHFCPKQCLHALELSSVLAFMHVSLSGCCLPLAGQTGTCHSRPPPAKPSCAKESPGQAFVYMTVSPLRRRFDWDHVCNQSDDQGRYSFRNQPGVCRWNCERLAEALAPVLPPGARNELAIFDQEYERCEPPAEPIASQQWTLHAPLCALERQVKCPQRQLMPSSLATFLDAADTAGPNDQQRLQPAAMLAENSRLHAALPACPSCQLCASIGAGLAGLDDSVRLLEPLWHGCGAPQPCTPCF